MLCSFGVVGKARYVGSCKVVAVLVLRTTYQQAPYMYVYTVPSVHGGPETTCVANGGANIVQMAVYRIKITHPRDAVTGGFIQNSTAEAWVVVPNTAFVSEP